MRNMSFALTTQQVLDLNTPTVDEIRRRYRELASQYHTDKPGGDHDKMAELNNARDEALKEIQS